MPASFGMAGLPAALFGQDSGCPPIGLTSNDFPPPAAAQLAVEGWTLCDDEAVSMTEEEEWTFCDRPGSTPTASSLLMTAGATNEKPSYADISSRHTSSLLCPAGYPSTATAAPGPAHRETIVGGGAAAAVRACSPTNAWSWARLAREPTPLAPLVLTYEKVVAGRGAEERSRSGSRSGKTSPHASCLEEGDSDADTDFSHYKSRGAKRRGCR